MRTKMYRLGRELNSVVCQRVTSTRGIQYWRTAIRWYISFILSQLFHLKKYQEIKKSKNQLFNTGVPSLEEVDELHN